MCIGVFVPIYVCSCGCVGVHTYIEKSIGMYNYIYTDIHIPLAKDDLASKMPIRLV